MSGTGWLLVAFIAWLAFMLVRNMIDDRGEMGRVADIWALAIVAGCAGAMLLLGHFFGNDHSTSSESPQRVSTPARAHGDIDCKDVAGPIEVSKRDPNDLDRDNDGIGCEPYP